MRGGKVPMVDISTLVELERWSDSSCNISLLYNPSYTATGEDKKLYVYDYFDTHNNIGFNYIEIAIIYIQKLAKKYHDK